jgi:hypothetical protein
MARFDLGGTTPIPVIKGTNYAEEFANRDAVRKRIEDAKLNPSMGPYSAMFDWKQEQADATALNEKKQLVQTKIMRTNAIGEALRLLGEGLAANQGAPVTQRNPNPFVLNAVNEYAKNDMDYINRLEGIKTKKLALGQMDLQTKIATASAQAERKHQEDMQATKELNDFIRESRLKEQEYKLRGLENEREAQRKRTQMAEQTLYEIEIARKKAQFERGIGLLDNGAKPTVDVFTPPKPGDKETLPFLTPDTKQTIYIKPELTNYIISQLSAGKSPYDQTLAKVFREIIANKKGQPEAIGKAFTDNWDYIRDHVLPAGVYEGIYGSKPPSGAATQQNQQPIQQSTTGEPSTGQPEGQEVLQKKIFDNLTNDTTNFLENDKAGRAKIGELADMIYANYLLQPGNKLTRNDAVTQANQIISKYRQLVRANAQ